MTRRLDGVWAYVAAVPLTVVAVVLACVNPLLGAAAMVPIALLLIPEFPSFWLVVGVLIVRALVDNSGGGGSLTSPTAIAAGTLSLVGCAVLLRARRGAVAIIVIALLLAASTLMAEASFGEVVLKEYLRTVSVLGVVIVCLNQRTPLSRRAAARAIQLITLAPALTAIIQIVTGNGVNIGGDIRASGTLAHPNSAALFFGIAMLVSIYRRGLTDRRRIDTILVCVFGLALLATLSVGGILSVACMTASYLILRRGVSGLSRVGMVVVLAGGFLALAFSPLAETRLSGLFDNGQRGTAASSLSWRLSNWGRVFDQVWEHPIFGQGYGATTSEMIVVGSIPHNEYLRALLEVGFAGSAAILACALVGVAIQVRRLNDTKYENAPALVLSVLLGLAVSATAANTFLYPMVGYSIALLFFAIGGKQASTSHATPGAIGPATHAARESNAA